MYYTVYIWQYLVLEQRFIECWALDPIHLLTGHSLSRELYRWKYQTRPTFLLHNGSCIPTNAGFPFLARLVTAYPCLRRERHTDEPGCKSHQSMASINDSVKPHLGSLIPLRQVHASVPCLLDSMQVGVVATRSRTIDPRSNKTPQYNLGNSQCQRWSALFVNPLLLKYSVWTIKQTQLYVKKCP